MFNTTVHKNTYSPTTKNIMNVNAVSGTIIKTNVESKMIRFHMTSETAKKVFNSIPHITIKVPKKEHHLEALTGASYYLSEYYKEKDIEIVVLQVMLCGNDEFLVEYIVKELYEKQLEELSNSYEIENLKNEIITLKEELDKTKYFEEVETKRVSIREPLNEKIITD